MDWSRAKSILILTFVVLNLFLATQLIQSMRQKPKIVNTNQVTEQQVSQLLKENKIQYVTNDNPYPNQVEVYQAEITQLDSPWKQNEEGIFVKTYSPAHSFKNDQELNQFLQSEIPFFSDYQLESRSSKKIIFLQRVNDQLIYDGKIEVHLSSPGKIQSIRVIHYSLKKLSPVKLIDPTIALYRLITNWGPPENTVISEAELGYRAKAYIGPGEAYILIPYWRFKSGQVAVYINATQRGLNEDVEVTELQNDNKGTK